jgi:hypothetical protein
MEACEPLRTRTQVVPKHRFVQDMLALGSVKPPAIARRRDAPQTCHLRRGTVCAMPVPPERISLEQPRSVNSR